MEGNRSAYLFGDPRKDGYLPQAGLSFDSAGNLYGTTYQGGSFSVGTVFQFAPTKTSWKYRVIHNFNKRTAAPLTHSGGIVGRGRTAIYYGTTYNGGYAYNAGTVTDCLNQGILGLEQTIFYFLEGGDGTNPDSSLAMDAKGNMYGTTYYGGDC